MRVWRCPGGKRFPHCQWRDQQRRLRDQGLPLSTRVDAAGCSSTPRCPCFGEARKARPRGEDPSTQTQSPLLLGKRRGAEKGAPAPPTTAARDEREVLRRGSALGALQLCPHATLALGVRLASAGRRGKKKKPKNEKKKLNRNKPNPRGMQCDNPKLEGPPGRRVEELGLQRGQQLSGHSSLHVTLQF